MPIKFSFTRKGASAPDQLLNVEVALNKELQGTDLGYEIGREDDFKHYPIIDPVAELLTVYMAKLPGVCLVTKLDQELARKVFEPRGNAEDITKILSKVLELYDFRAWYQAHNF